MELLYQIVISTWNSAQKSKVSLQIDKLHELANTGFICTKQWGQHTIFSKVVLSSGAEKPVALSAQMGSCSLCAVLGQSDYPWGKTEVPPVIQGRICSNDCSRHSLTCVKLSSAKEPSKRCWWTTGKQSLFSLQGWSHHSALPHAMTVELLGKNACTFYYLSLKKHFLSLKHSSIGILKHLSLKYFFFKATSRDTALSFTHGPAHHTTAEPYRAQGNTWRRIIRENLLFLPYKWGTHPHFTPRHCLVWQCLHFVLLGHVPYS